MRLARVFTFIILITLPACNFLSTPQTSTPIPLATLNQSAPIVSTSTPFTLPSPTLTNTPDISLNGHIAFVSQLADGYRQEIYVMNADGQEQTRLTFTSADSVPPQWSHDGNKIAYTTSMLGDDPGSLWKELWVINSEGAVKTFLYKGWVDGYADWSINDKEIVFACKEGLCIVNSDGTDLKTIPHTTTNDYLPTWSQNGKILFYSVGVDKRHTINSDGSERSAANFSGLLLKDDKLVNISKNSITVQNINGEEIFKLGLTATRIQQLTLSPDKSKIAFVIDNGSLNIYVFDIEGFTLSALTNNTAWNNDPAWSPDGARIAFSSNRTGDFEIYIMNADGSRQTQLTFNPGNDVMPSWQP